MTYSLGWHADGIARAEAAGGITLEVYRKAGFTGGGIGVRPYTSGGGSLGIPIEPDPDYWEYEEDRSRSQRRRRSR